MVLDDADLLGNDVELFADFNADLDQGDTVVGTNALRFRQLMADDVAWQIGVERLAATFLALMGRHVNFHCRLFRDRRTCRGQRFDFVEEHVLLLATTSFRFGIEQLA